jgi:WD40 repeat protein
VSTSEETIRIWNINTGICENLINIEPRFEHFYALRNGNFLCHNREDRTVLIWDPDTGDCEWTLGDESTPENFLLELSDGRLLTTSADHDNEAMGLDERLKIWNPDTGDCELTLKGSHIVFQAVELPDGRLVSLGSHTSEIKIWTLHK